MTVHLKIWREGGPFEKRRLAACHLGFAAKSVGMSESRFTTEVSKVTCKRCLASGVKELSRK